MRKEPKAIEFTYERTLKLRRPKFALSENIRYLDPVKLSKGSHTIELGKFEECGCDCVVTAMIKDGMITGINYPKCKHTQPIPPRAVKALAAARKKLTKNDRRKWRDIPVHEIINNPAMARETTTTIDDGDCVMICWQPPLGGSGEICIICCGLNSPDIRKAWCIGPSEPAILL